VRRFLGRTLLIALVVSLLLVGVIVALDFFGEQPQPFQYLLH
jgi:hypothetical protein